MSRITLLMSGGLENRELIDRFPPLVYVQETCTDYVLIIVSWLQNDHSCLYFFQRCRYHNIICTLAPPAVGCQVTNQQDIEVVLGLRSLSLISHSSVF